jgi:integrase
MELNQRLEDWLSARAESPKTRDSYLFLWENFAEFCRKRGKDPLKLVDDYRAVKYLGEAQREKFLEEWQDLLRAFYSWLKPKFAPLTVKNHLVVVRSFLGFWKIPLDVDLPKHPCVIWHNRDLRKEELKQILTFASARDRVIWLAMAESGMRSDTAVNLKYSEIREDFEAKRVPMKILLPSSLLKDHVGDRWSFIGEDGFRELSDYLQGRLPLQNNDFVFSSEKKGKVKGEQFSPASLSVKFGRIVLKLGIDKSVSIDATTGKLRKGERPKPKQIRLHGLRKFFRNNMRAEKGYLDFWMGHGLGVDAHYISRDPEEHRQRYLQGYKFLRLYEASPETLSDVYQQIRDKDKQIKELQSRIEKLEPFLQYLEELQSDPDKPLELFVRGWLRECEKGMSEGDGWDSARVSEELSKKLSQALLKSLNLPKRKPKSP